MQSSKKTSSEEFPVFVSYYTPDTAYEERAEELRQSLEKFGLDHVILPVVSKGDWTSNCAQKAEVIQRLRSEVSKPVCWVDADCRILRKPGFLRDFNHDFAVVNRMGWRFASGQIVFGTSKKADRIFDEWLRLCRTYPQIWDQVSLTYAWWNVSLTDDLDTFWLPESSMCISHTRWRKRLFKRLTTRAVFYHEQESRRSRKSLPSTSLGDREEFRSEDLPDWFRQSMMKLEPFELDGSALQELGLNVEVEAENTTKTV